MWFSTFIIANLLGRPTRSLLTLCGIALAVAAVVSLVGVVRGFENSLLELYQRRGIDLMVHQSGRVQMTASVLPEVLKEDLLSIDGVSAVYPSLIDVVSLLDDDMMGVVIQGWPPDSAPVRELDIAEGRAFYPADRRVILLGRRLAVALKAKVGDWVELIDDSAYEVLGVFDSANVFESGSVVMRLDDLQELMLREGDVTAFAVVAKDRDPEAVSALSERITTSRANWEASPVAELARDSTEIRVARSFAWLTSAIALMIGSIGMLNTMMMAVFERTREIAMLRALGWKRRRVIGMILGESILLSTAGAILGIAAAVVSLNFLAQMPSAGRLVATGISWQIMLQGWLMALLLGMLGGLYPAWAAARVSPVEGLRHD